MLADVQHDRTADNFPVLLGTFDTESFELTGTTALPLYHGDPGYNKFEQFQYRMGYLFEHRFDDVFTVRSGLRYGELDLDYRNMGLLNVLTTADLLFDPDPIQERTAISVESDLSTLAVDNHLEMKLRTGAVRHTILTGIDYQRLSVDHTRLEGEAPPLSILNPVYGQFVPMPTVPFQSFEQDAHQLGVYAQDQAKLGNLRLTFGGRYDWSSIDTLDRLALDGDTAQKDEAFTGRIGLAYLFPFGVAPYASYSESFQPTLGRDRLGGVFEPTTGQQYETGIRIESADRKSRLSLAVFDLTQQNVLTPDPADINNEGCSVQTGEINSRGFEAEWVANPFPGLQLIAAYTKFDMEVTKSTNPLEIGTTPTLTPEEMASIFIDYTFQSGVLKGFGFGGGMRYTGASFANSFPNLVSGFELPVYKNDAQTLFDATLHYTTGDTTYAVNASNLLDDVSVLCEVQCYFSAPRIVTATVRHRW